MSAKSGKGDDGRSSGKAVNGGNSSKGPITENELLEQDYITPDDVLRLTKATTAYLVRPEANIYDINFVRFKLRDIATKQTLFEVSKPESSSPSHEGEEEDYDELDPTNGRFVRYQFTPQFLKLKTVGATVEFTLGDKPVNKFRMIERHYFRNRLLKSFDFEFGFLIPMSKNTMEHIYEFPDLSKEQMEQMIDCPYETRSDSFYFVDDKLIMHNKADYSYNGTY
uniref:Uncharacterized protein unc119 n=1 Tax=Enchytraeus japonensis TaxID=228735 RepID=Q1MXG1_9ANNE|nr:hypothetical protein similar to Unc-119 [Enchytraeus japonensis]